MFSVGTPVKHVTGTIGWIECCERTSIRVHWIKFGPDGGFTSVYTLGYARMILERI
jgi:hypothetical protein